MHSHKGKKANEQQNTSASSSLPQAGNSIGSESKAPGPQGSHSQLLCIAGMSPLCTTCRVASSLLLQGGFQRAKSCWVRYSHVTESSGRSSTALTAVLLLVEPRMGQQKPKCLLKATWVPPRSYVPSWEDPYGFSFSTHWRKAGCENGGRKKTKSKMQFPQSCWAFIKLNDLVWDRSENIFFAGEGVLFVSDWWKKLNTGVKIKTQTVALSRSWELQKRAQERRAGDPRRH